MKMSLPMYLAVLILMVTYCKSDQIDQTIQSKDVEPRRCYQCSGASCGMRPPLTATCPAERPYCATVANAPNYTSSLTCAASSESPCSLTNSSKLTLELICVCASHLCNAPFSMQLQQELITFTSTNTQNNRTDYIEMFWKHSRLVNDNDAHIYKKITMTVLESTETPMINLSEMSVVSTSAVTAARAQSPGAAGQYAGHYGRQYAGIGGAPLAEMLRQDKVLPPDYDDEDQNENEGSGTDDDMQSPRRTSPSAPDTPAAPVSPSAFLPADDSDATRPFLALIATIPAFYMLV